MPENRADQEISPLEPTRNVYQKPFPEDTIITGIEKNGPSHEGPYRGAIDFLCAVGTPVLSPLDGVVVNVVDQHDRFGPSEEFADDLNYATLRHANGEFSQVAHLAKGSAQVKPGDRVTTGQQIAVSGNSGWMTEPHIHFFVFGVDGKDFQGKEIRFNEV